MFRWYHGEMLMHRPVHGTVALGGISPAVLAEPDATWLNTWLIRARGLLENVGAHVLASSKLRRHFVAYLVLPKPFLHRVGANSTPSAPRICRHFVHTLSREF